jgi:hypothetical protein
LLTLVDETPEIDDKTIETVTEVPITEVYELGKDLGS